MTQRLQRPEGQIAYDVDGAGPLVVCVPGMADLRAAFRHLAPALVAGGFRVATMELRGHGESDPTFSSYDDLAAASDIVALIETLGGPAVVVGSSMGAGAGAIAAADRPDLVSGLALLGPFLRNPPTSRWMAPLLSLMLMRPWGPLMLKAWLPKLYPGAVPQGQAEYLSAVLNNARRPGYWPAFHRTTRTSHAPVEARLDDVKSPAIVLMGELDPDFKDPAAEARWIGERLGAEVLIVPDAGHYPHAQRPDLVSPAIVTFARQVAGA